MFIKRETRSGRNKLGPWDKHAHTTCIRDNEQEPTV